MVVYEFDSVELKGKINVPSTAEEYDKLAGREGACVDAAVDYTVFHKLLTAFRDDMAEAIEKKYNIKPKTKKDEKGKDVLDEKPGVFIARVAAELGVELSEEFQPLADEWSQKADFAKFLIVRERKAPTPAKKWLAKAKELLADPNRLERAKAKFESFSIKTDEATFTDETKLAFAIADLADAISKQALA